jgi:DNA-binding transcriptional LysR family regulator
MKPGCRSDWWNDHDAIAMFVAIVETGSFSKAAESVRRSQPTISNRVSALERAVGAVLLSRARNRVRATQAGRILYEQARLLLAAHEATRQRVARFLGGVEGILTVAAGTIPGTYLLPRALAAFQRRYPQVTSRLIISNSRDVLRRIRDGEADLGVTGMRPHGGDISVVPLEGDHVVIAAPSRHPLSRRRGPLPIPELQKLPLVLREPGSGTRQVVEKALARRRLRLSRDFRVVGEFNSTEGVREAVRAGLGVGFLSSLAVKGPAGRSGLCCKGISGTDLSRSFYIVYKKAKTVSPLLKIFHKHLVG